MTINELVESFGITLDNAIILGSMSIFTFVGIKIMEGLFYGISLIMRDITKFITKISEKRKKPEIVIEERENG